MLDIEISTNVFWRSLQSIKDSFASIDRFEIQIGGELAQMRDDRLFVEGGYTSFEEFCDKELSQWGGYRRVNQLLGAGRVIEALKDSELSGTVKRESHARPLLRLVETPQKLHEAVAIACQLSPAPTAKDFAEAAKKVSPLPQKKPKVQEQLFLKGTIVRVSPHKHPRFEQEGVICADPPNTDQQIVSFGDNETHELINTSDLAIVIPPVERKSPPAPKTYTEEELQAEINRAIAESKIGLKVEAEERAIASVREQMIASEKVIQSKVSEVIRLQQKVDELESLRLLEFENQRLLQRIADLERSQEDRGTGWGNTFTKQAEKAVSAVVLKRVEELEPELHLRSLSVNPPTENQSSVVNLLGLSLEATAQSMPRLATELRKAAAIILQVDETSLEKKVFQLRQLPEAIASIKQVLSLPDADWVKFTQVSDNYQFIKQEIWMGLNPQEREKINLMKSEYPAPNVQCPMPNIPFPISSKVLIADAFSTRAKVPGTVIGIENEMFLVHWDDCDRPLFQHRYEATELRLVEVTE
jgi:hypothetical protein